MIEATRTRSGQFRLIAARRGIHQSSGRSDTSSQFQDATSVDAGRLRIDSRVPPSSTRRNAVRGPATLATGWSPIVLVTTPPQPAANARSIVSGDSVGGAEASRNGFSNRMPVKMVDRSAIGTPWHHQSRTRDRRRRAIGRESTGHAPCRAAQTMVRRFGLDNRDECPLARRPPVADDRRDVASRGVEGEMVRIVIGLVLLAHGIGHSIGLLGMFKVATVNPAWNGDSWILSGSAGPTVTQAVGVVLWTVSMVGFAALAAIVFGWLPETWWVPLAVVSSVASLAGVLFFPIAFPTFSTIGAVAVDVAVLVAVLVLPLGAERPRRVTGREHAEVPAMTRRSIRLAAALLSAGCAIVYLMIGFEVVKVVEAPPADGSSMLGFGGPAALAFALGAVLLLTVDRRWVWVLGAASR